MIKISNSSGYMPDNKLELIFYKTKTRCCFWCGRRTSFIKGFVAIKGIKPLSYMATVEHLFSRTDIRRFYYNHFLQKASPIVLSCYKCNNNRMDLRLEDFAVKKKKKLDFNYKYIFI